MPWTTQDVEKHNKGLTDHQKSVWVEVANKSLGKSGDDASAIRIANSVVKKMHETETTIEAKLYNKASKLIDAVRLQEIAALFEASPLDNEPEGVLRKHGWKVSREHGDRTIYTHPEKSGHEIHLTRKSGDWNHFDKAGKTVKGGFTGEKLKHHLGEEVLAEADPKPRVEKDHLGKPVIPTRQQYLMYFQDMQASHIKDAIRSAHDRWAKAEKDAEESKAAAADKKDKAATERAQMAYAVMKALGVEVAVGHTVLRSKERKVSKIKKKENRKIQTHNKGVQKFVKSFAGGLSGKSPLIQALAHHLTSKLLPSVNKSK